MSENNKKYDDEIVIESKRRRNRNKENVENFQGNDFGERLSFTVGVCYISAGMVGFAKGMVEAMPKNFSLPKKLIFNNFFNKCGKETCRFGNASAAAGLLYFLTGQSLNFLHQEELADISNVSKNMLCGAMTGALYKSTLGIIPICVGAGLGSTLIGALTILNQHLNQKGLIAFEMRF